MSSTCDGRVNAIWHQHGEPGPTKRIWREGRYVSLEHPSTRPAWFDRDAYLHHWRPRLRPSERDHVWPNPGAVDISDLDTVASRLDEAWQMVITGR